MIEDEEAEHEELPDRPWDWAIVPIVVFEVGENAANTVAAFFNGLKAGAISHFQWRAARRALVETVESGLKEPNLVVPDEA